jgi:3-dehydroquinate synthase II
VNKLVKTVWIRTDLPEDFKERKELVISALENSLFDIVLREDDKEPFSKIGKLRFIQIEEDRIKGPEFEGIIVNIKSAEDCERAVGFAGNVPYVLVKVTDWKVIPVENLIAGFQGSNSRLIAEVETVQEAKLFFETLERGVDGIVLATTDPAEIGKIRTLLDENTRETLTLVTATISGIKPVGSGDRACIDCCSQMEIGEGMLIGSQSQGLFLIHSETVESEYIASRPFRVNAGALHSYILLPGNRTKYLSELSAGDEVLVVNSKGRTRKAVLGRVKIEMRPLLLLEARCEGFTYNIILQNAETIRLVSNGEPRSIVDLKEGDEVLIWIDDSARHFGMKVKESVKER